MKNFPVLYASIVSEESQGFLEGNGISKSDSEYYSQYMNISRKRQSFECRELARKALFEQTGVEGHDWEFKVLKGGGRQAVSVDGICLNVSFAHTRRYSVVAISDAAVGVDVEMVKQGRPWQKMQSYFPKPSELPPYRSQIDFLAGWTAYEAEIKFRSTSSKQVSFQHFYPFNGVVVCLATAVTSSAQSEISVCFR